MSHPASSHSRTDAASMPRNKLGFAHSEGDLANSLQRGVHPPRRSSSRLLIQQSRDNLLSVMHQESRWESEGGWRPNDHHRHKEHKFERDASMVHLLNLLDPESLIDKKDVSEGSAAANGRPRSDSTHSTSEQHSALSRRGIVLVGTASALGWYLLRLVLRDKLNLTRYMRSSRRRGVLELHIMSSLHALGWVFMLLKKLRSPTEELSAGCSRALVASLGFYIHDCWSLRGTLLQNPEMFAHQAALAATISSILRSKGVAWLSVPLMSQAIPTLMQELLQVCTTINLPPSRPEIRGLRIMWFISFLVSKLALIPCWLRNYDRPEMHQPNLLVGKVGFLVGLFLNLHFVFTGAKDLRGFFRPAGEVVSAAAAYEVPLSMAMSIRNNIVSGLLLGGVFSSYMAAPAAAILSLLSLRSRAPRWLRASAGLLSASVVADLVLPQPKECSVLARKIVPLTDMVSKSFEHRFYPTNDLDTMFKRDRHNLVAVTPHGFFPWGVGLIIVDCLKQGYLPNFVGASVLGALPIAGRILRLVGFLPATEKEIRRCLKKTYPRNVTIIVPGGIREMFCIRPDAEISAANLRFGFVRLAKEEGAILWPAYMLGNSQLYRVATGSIGQFFERVSRKLRTSINLFHGVGGTMLPYPQKLACALGKAIDTREMDDVKDIHKLFCQRVREAFDANKETFGWPRRQLYFEGESMPPVPDDPMQHYTALPSLRRMSKL
mmetsp:Transcript_5629/g.13224  ORF Transcript_5629/g.13224 Transcript_5629/m.13224 type:complete len:719 (-) Transcript_5629:17-2173(-)